MLKTISSAILLAASIGPASAQDWSIDVYGGMVADGSLIWDGDAYDTGNGKTLGFGIYSTAMVNGLALGVDVMSSGTDYVDYTDSISAVSLMLAGRYAIPLGDRLSATLGGGIGAMRVSYDAGEEAGFASDSSTVLGGQAELGLRYQMEGGPTVFGAVKYQSTFGDVEFDDGLVAEYDTTSAILGISFRM
ncbi:MAG: porin family protein [Tabrizicola sp.]|nr:porin family protein [Tabrizicola sp.]